MSKRKVKVNKSAEIRTVLENSPKMPTGDVIATLKKKGIEVSSTLVAQNRPGSKSSKKKRGGKKPSTTLAVGGGLNTPDDLDHSMIPPHLASFPRDAAFYCMMQENEVARLKAENQRLALQISALVAI